MKNSFARLFERARQEVPFRPDLTPALLLSIVSACPRIPEPDGQWNPACASFWTACAHKDWAAAPADLPRDQTVMPAEG
jgi:hypothetical protein